MNAVSSPGGFMVAALARASARGHVRVPVVERSPVDLAMGRYADGDRAAGGELYERLRPRLYAIGFQWTRSHGASEDLVQETFLRLLEARGTFRTGAAVMPWASQIARNLLRDGHRRLTFERWVVEVSLRQGCEPLDGAPPADEALARRRREAALAEDLAHLRPEYREPFRLIRLEGLPVARVARRLGITPGMVKIRTFRAAAALRRADERRRRGEREG